VTSLRMIEGIGTAYAKKFAVVGVKSVEKFLDLGKSPEGRLQLAERAGVSPENVLTWVNHADLFRVKGIAGQYAELLERVGVQTVVQLSQREAEPLHAALTEANKIGRRICRQIPPVKTVESWIEHAGKLEEVVSR
jgi:predicted flap endonuclease-1-like 5' DNA nuclease